MSKQYLVQTFEPCYRGQHFISEKVVLGEEGIRDYLNELTFSNNFINKVIIERYYETTHDIVIIKEQESDGSFDSYYVL